MCFTPTISLTTAIIEFAIATIILIFYRKSLINKFFITLVYVLGLYQFTEFMLCASNNPILWTKLGFITYTFLPAIAIYYCLKYTLKTNKQKYFSLIYLIPIIYSIITIFSKQFITERECSQFFVIGYTALYAISPLLSIIYNFYYAISIIVIIILIINKISREKNKIKKKIHLYLLLAIILSLVPAIILIIIFPSLEIMFFSIYCEFALLFGIAALIVARLDSKLKK